ncbi:hypothetical protein D3M71_21325 [Erwinia billingiae]|nr:hypothetical protein [Erwinia billingiae]
MPLPEILLSDPDLKGLYHACGVADCGLSRIEIFYGPVAACNRILLSAFGKTLDIQSGYFVP